MTKVGNTNSVLQLRAIHSRTGENPVWMKFVTTSHPTPKCGHFSVGTGRRQLYALSKILYTSFISEYMYIDVEGVCKAV